MPSVVTMLELRASLGLVPHSSNGERDYRVALTVLRRGSSVSISSYSTEVKIMPKRRLWAGALMVIALAAWRLGNPATAGAAAPRGPCGAYICAESCTEADDECEGCEWWQCTTSPTPFCSFSVTILCGGET